MFRQTRAVKLIVVFTSIFGFILFSTQDSVAIQQQEEITSFNNVGTSELSTNSLQVFLPIISSVQHPPWPMAGANPERTSWTPEGVGGRLTADWIKPIEPYISQKVQIIAAEGKLFISTARGLYALDAETGSEVWVYPTALPLGHSPTYHRGILYVGGFDRKIHAIDAKSGKGLWTFTAGAGFSTNPLVVAGYVYAGNRDGYFYAIHAHGTPQAGELAWRFKTDGPILYSAAYKDGVVYFASNDAHAYALNATVGSLVWKSDKLVGLGFHSWWPVIYRDVVIFTARLGLRGSGTNAESNELYTISKESGLLLAPLGEEPGDWVAGTPTLDMSKVNPKVGVLSPVDYFEQKPSWRTVIVLDRATGKEKVYDLDGDGKRDYPPILLSGVTGSITRYPPVVGYDGVLYFRNNYMADGSIQAGGVTGWKIGTPFVSIPHSREIGGWGDWPVDEPSAVSAGGTYIYHVHCNDRVLSSFDLAMPNLWPPPERVSAKDSNPRQWRYDNWKLEGYDSQLYQYLWHPDPEKQKPGGGFYYAHGDQNPLIPYKGRVYVHRGNAVIALGPGTTGHMLPVAKTVSVAQPQARSKETLKAILVSEVQKMIAAGHLRPGFFSIGGVHDNQLNKLEQDILEYYHNPADTLYVLLRALPHLPSDLRQQTINYIKSEYNTYPPQTTSHIGWEQGASREPFFQPESNKGWTSRKSGIKPQSFYALWKYAVKFGGAVEIFDQVKNSLPDKIPLPDSELAYKPHIHNAYIAGYIGYLELQKLAGLPESNAKKAELNRLLALRVSQFTADLLHPDASSGGSANEGRYYYSMIVSWNFMHMVPELADYLRDNALSKVTQAVDKYERIAPHWFIAKAEEMQGEGTLMPPHNFHDLFQAKGLILKQPYGELEKFIDVPAFSVGDLFYINNLITAIEAEN